MVTGIEIVGPAFERLNLIAPFFKGRQQPQSQGGFPRPGVGSGNTKRDYFPLFRQLLTLTLTPNLQIKTVCS